MSAQSGHSRKRRLRVGCRWCGPVFGCFFAVWLGLLRFVKSPDEASNTSDHSFVQRSTVVNVSSIHPRPPALNDLHASLDSAPIILPSAREVEQVREQLVKPRLVSWSNPPSFVGVGGGEQRPETDAGGSERGQPSRPIVDTAFPAVEPLPVSKVLSSVPRQGSEKFRSRSKTIVVSSLKPKPEPKRSHEQRSPQVSTPKRKETTILDQASSRGKSGGFSPSATASVPFTLDITPVKSASSSSSVTVYIEGVNNIPSRLLDFPCPSSASPLLASKYATMCKVDCRDDSSGNNSTSCGVELCDRFVECHAVVHYFMGGSESGGGGGGGLRSSPVHAVLKTDPEELLDDSMARLKASKWWGTPEFDVKPRPRLYVVASYGGSGSKMLGGFLQGLPDRHRTNIWHLHDRFPPLKLRALTAKGSVVNAVKAPEPQYVNVRQRPKSKTTSIYDQRHRVGEKKKNSRDINFGGDTRFRNDTDVLNALAIGDYRVIFIFKDPSEALVSRYSHEHCVNVQGDCGSAKGFPNLTSYAENGVDHMHLMDHFSAYAGREVLASKAAPNVAPSAVAAVAAAAAAAARNYPVVCLNYHKLWTNLPAVMLALGLPADLAKSFPKRKEKVRTAGGDRHGGGGSDEASEQTRAILRKMYRPLVDAIAVLPAVMVA